jgi:hypothetical protein
MYGYAGIVIRPDSLGWSMNVSGASRVQNKTANAKYKSSNGTIFTTVKIRDTTNYNRIVAIGTNDAGVKNSYGLLACYPDGAKRKTCGEVFQGSTVKFLNSYYGDEALNDSNWHFLSFSWGLTDSTKFNADGRYSPSPIITSALAPNYGTSAYLKLFSSISSGQPFVGAMSDLVVLNIETDNSYRQLFYNMALDNSGFWQTDTVMTGLPDSLTIDTATATLGGRFKVTGTYVIHTYTTGPGGTGEDSVVVIVGDSAITPVIIDSAICKVRRAVHLDYFRIGDTGTVKFNEIYDSAATCSLWVNRGMTIVTPIIGWYNNVYPEEDSIQFKIPVGTPLNYYYRMKIRNQYGIKNEDPIVHTLFVKGQVR